MDQEIMDNPVPEINVGYDEEPELVLVGSEDEIPVEEPDEPVVDEEKEQLRQQADVGQQISSTLSELLSKQQSAPVQQPQVQTPQVEEYTKEQLAKDMFGDDPGGAVDRYINEQMSKKLQGATAGNIQLAKMVYKNDPSKSGFFNKYEGEIDQMIGTLPVGQRTDPRAVEWAYKQVQTNHIDELVAEKVQAAMAQGQEDPAPVKRSVQGTHVEGSTVPPATKKKKKYMVASDEDKILAMRKGMTVEQYMKFKRRK